MNPTVVMYSSQTHSQETPPFVSWNSFWKSTFSRSVLNNCNIKLQHNFQNVIFVLFLVANFGIDQHFFFYRSWHRHCSEGAFSPLTVCTWWVLQLVQSSHLPSASVLYFCLLLLGHLQLSVTVSLFCLIILHTNLLQIPFFFPVERNTLSLSQSTNC